VYICNGKSLLIKSLLIPNKTKYYEKTFTHKSLERRSKLPRQIGPAPCCPLGTDGDSQRTGQEATDF
jgi:hypothetical protein